MSKLIHSFIPVLIGSYLFQLSVGSFAWPKETKKIVLKSAGISPDILQKEIRQLSLDAVSGDEVTLKQDLMYGIETLVRKQMSGVKATDNGSACACSKYNCGCCEHVEWERVDLNDTVCANFSYLPAPDYGVAVTLSVNNKIVYKKEVSVRNPPPLCAGVPYLKKYASLCVKFENLTWTNSSLQGCVVLTAKLEGFEVERLKLGCFKIPPGNGTVTARPVTGQQRYGTDNDKQILDNIGLALNSQDVPDKWMLLRKKEEQQANISVN